VHSLFLWLCFSFSLSTSYHLKHLHIMILFLSYVRVLESEASLDSQDPPQEVALDIKLNYIYKVSQAFLSQLTPNDLLSGLGG
jgi:hypothetical protein